VETIAVPLRDRSYPIYVGTGILTSVGRLAREKDLSRRALILTNPTIGTLYGEAARASLEEAGFETTVIEIPDGEGEKSLERAAFLYRELLRHRMDRRSPFFALGGGVIGDLGGFVAATFMRGIPLIQIPTSLVAQVDASIGGKVAVNLPEGKNLIGAFYQPLLVLADVGFLRTLPERELKAGLAEVVKYGVIADPGLFRYLELNLEAILARDQEALTEIVLTSCRIKAGIVAEDEREEGRRVILNFGHTVGHAIEALTGYTRFRHGEAVAIGMLAAAMLSFQRGLCREKDLQRIRDLLARIGLPTALPVPPGEIITAILYDKKVRETVPRLVLTKGIGHVTVSRVDDLKELEEVLASLQE